MQLFCNCKMKKISTKDNVRWISRMDDYDTRHANHMRSSKLHCTSTNTNAITSISRARSAVSHQSTAKKVDLYRHAATHNGSPALHVLPSSQHAATLTHSTNSERFACSEETGETVGQGAIVAVSFSTLSWPFTLNSGQDPVEEYWGSPSSP